MLEGLPEELLVKIVLLLDDHSHNGDGGIERCLAVLPCVCRAWSEALGPDKTRFWWGLGEVYGILPSARARRRISKSRKRSRSDKSGDTRSGSTPRSSDGIATGRRSTRSTQNAKRTFFQRKHELDAAFRHEADKVVWDLWKRLRKNDCAAFVQRKLLSLSSQSLSPRSPNHRFPSAIVRHRVVGLERRNLLLLACWWGRAKTVEMLLKEPFEASIFVVDDGNASPLLVAAWAGHAAVVKLILAQLENDRSNKDGDPDRNNCSNCSEITQTNGSASPATKCRDYLDLRGIPPLTSSCGGKGPKTAIDWAGRKGFRTIVRLLEQAGATPAATGTTAPARACPGREEMTFVPCDNNSNDGGNTGASR